MNGLEDVFQGRALTYEEWKAALEERQNVQLDKGGMEDLLYGSALQELKEARETIVQLKRQLEEWMKRYTVDMKQVRLDAAVDAAILKAGGRNVKAIRALLDLRGVSLKEDGTLVGLDLEGLKKTDGYLFDEVVWEKQGVGMMTGGTWGQDLTRKQFEDAVWAR